MNAPKHITSRDNPLLVTLRRLAADPGGYRKLGQIWIEGEHLCRACAARGLPVVQAVLSESGWAQEPLRTLAQRAASVVVVADRLFAGLSALESPAPIGFLLARDAVVLAASLRPGIPTVVLDRLQDAGNVGAVLRSAAAFGFTQVIALKGTAALWSPKVLRAGMGAHFSLSLIEGADQEQLRALALPLVATSSHASTVIASATLPTPCAWVFGHEGQGVSQQLLERCALAVRIPQPGGEESLNVAAAAAICLYESIREPTGG